MPACPQCGQRFQEGDYLCPFCSVMLPEPSSAERKHKRVPTLVEALLTPQPGADEEEPPKPPKPATKHYDPDAPTQHDEEPLMPVPEGVAIRLLDMDVDEADLTAYEAYFISLIDPNQPAEAIRKAAKINAKEFATVVQSLRNKGVIELEEITDPRTEPVRKGKAEARHEREPQEPAAPDREHPRARATPPRGVPVSRMTPIREKQRAPVEERPGPPVAQEPRMKIIPLPPKRDPNAPLKGAVVLSPLEQATDLEKAGNWQEAVSVLEKAIRKTRKPGPLYNRLAIVIARYRKDFLEAERLIKQAIELEPENTVYQQNLLRVVSMAAADSGASGNRKKR